MGAKARKTGTRRLVNDLAPAHTKADNPDGGRGTYKTYSMPLQRYIGAVQPFLPLRRCYIRFCRIADPLHRRHIAQRGARLGTRSE